jgi:hypothetical protein
MNKLYSLAILLFFVQTTFAQVDCSSGRFDTEVFSGVDISTNVVYGANTDYNGSNLSLTMDIYQPQGDTMLQRPLIVWVHGGSFISGTKNDLDVQQLCEHFAKRGYVCATINYRLGISFPYNQANATNAVYRAVQDFKAAVRFFRKDAATTNTYKIDPNIVYSGGSSAGAFTVLHAAYMDQYSELPASIDTSALGDLEGNSGNPGYASNVNAVVDLCGALGDAEWVYANDIPLCAMHGDHDNTVPYATDIIRLLGAFPIMTVDGSYSICNHADSVGLENVFYTYFGSDHVPYYGNAAYMDTTVRFVSNFLYKQLGCTPADPNPLPNTFNLTNSVREFTFENNIYPNPSTGIIKVSTPANSFIQIHDLLGKIILSQKTTSPETTIDLSNFKGIYFLSIDGGGRLRVVIR